MKITLKFVVFLRGKKKKQRKKETPSIERRRKYATVEKKLTAETDKKNPETNIRKNKPRKHINSGPQTQTQSTQQPSCVEL